MNLLKAEIRAWLRPLRRLISKEHRQAASIAAARHFSASPFFREQRFACYLALPDELDTLPLMQTLWHAGKACYVPLVSSAETEKRLDFALYEEGMKLELNRYRVLEPSKPTQRLSAAELDVVVLPLLAFDGRGNRLGSGGGYYDRTFAFRSQPGVQPGTKPRLLGLAYELQRVDAIPQEPFDVGLEGVITEEGVSVF